MSKKRDIYNEMDSEDQYAEGYPSYYDEEDVDPEPEPEDDDEIPMVNGGGGATGAGAGYIDDEAEEDPYADYYDPEWEEYLMRQGYMIPRGAGRGRQRYDEYDYPSDSDSVSSSSSSSSFQIAHLKTLHQIALLMEELPEGNINKLSEQKPRERKKLLIPGGKRNEKMPKSEFN